MDIWGFTALLRIYSAFLRIYRVPIASARAAITRIFRALLLTSRALLIGATNTNEGTLHKRMSHVARMDESRHTIQRVNDSCHAHRYVKTCIVCLGTSMKTC